MIPRIPVSRRRFLAGAAAATATVAGGIASPYLSRAADRPLVTHGVQSGDVSLDGGVIWARADRPARMLAEIATTESFKTIHRAGLRRCLAGNRFHGQRPDRRPARRAGHLLPHPLPGPVVTDDRRRGPHRPLPHGAERPALDLVRVVGRYRRPGLGHRRGARRHAHLCDHAAQSPGFLHPQRRHHLCRQSDPRAAEDAERGDLAERGERGQGQGGGNARRVPRQLQVQSGRQARARLQCRGPDLRAMGRPRGHQQLVAGRAVDAAGACAPGICREERARAGGARRRARFTNTCRCAGRNPNRAASIAGFPTDRCSTYS